MDVSHRILSKRWTKSLIQTPRWWLSFFIHQHLHTCSCRRRVRLAAAAAVSMTLCRRTALTSLLLAGCCVFLLASPRRLCSCPLGLSVYAQNFFKMCSRSQGRIAYTNCKCLLNWKCLIERFRRSKANFAVTFCSAKIISLGADLVLVICYLLWGFRSYKVAEDSITKSSYLPFQPATRSIRMSLIYLWFWL